MGDVSVVVNEDDLDRILSQSEAIIGSFNKPGSEASIQCNGMSATVDLTDIDCSSGSTSGSGFGGVNSGRVTPGLSNSATALANCPSPVGGTLTTCAACVTAVRTDSPSVIVCAGAASGQLVPGLTNAQPGPGTVQTVRLMPPQPLRVPGPSTAVVNGRLPNTANASSIVTMLMRPSVTPAPAAAQLRLGAGRSASPAAPAASVQLVNVGVESATPPPPPPRIVVVTSGVNMMQAGVSFIQSAPQQQQQQQQRPLTLQAQQLRPQQQQVIA